MLEYVGGGSGGSEVMIFFVLQSIIENLVLAFFKGTDDIKYSIAISSAEIAERA